MYASFEQYLHWKLHIWMPVCKFWMLSITSVPDCMSVTTFYKISICRKNFRYTLNIRDSLPDVSDRETRLDRLLEQFVFQKYALFQEFFLKLGFNFDRCGFYMQLFQFLLHLNKPRCFARNIVKSFASIRTEQTLWNVRTDRT
jgi:hypothetical protein